MMKRVDKKHASRVLRVDVIEHGGQARPGCTACEIGVDLDFSTARLESYCLVKWEPVVFELPGHDRLQRLLTAAATRGTQALLQDLLDRHSDASGLLAELRGE